MEMHLKTGDTGYIAMNSTTRCRWLPTTTNAETRVSTLLKLNLFSALSTQKPCFQEDRDVSELMMSYWSTAKNGDPQRPRASQMACLWR